MTTNGHPGDEALATILGLRAASMPEVEVTTDGPVATYRRAGRRFAIVGPDGAAFLLGRTIVAAALRTPDTGPSEDGPEWVAFRPASLDTFAIDRATAWLEAAWRRAGGDGAGT